MANETNLKFWRDIRTFRDKLRVDVDLRESFHKDPISIIKEHGFDLSLPGKEGESPSQTLSSLLERMTDVERRATIESLIEVSNIPDIDRTAVVTPVANANAGANANAAANANAGANANAAANANTNTNGMVASDLLPTEIYKIVLPADFDKTELAAKLDALQLNNMRQQALFKRALTDVDSLVETKQVGNDELRVARYAYRGTVFEIEGVIRGGEISIVRAETIG